MKKSLMFPFLFAALLALCACTQGTKPDAPTANAGITLTLRAAEHPELDFGMAGEQRALMDFAVGTDSFISWARTGRSWPIAPTGPWPQSMTWP